MIIIAATGTAVLLAGTVACSRAAGVDPAESEAASAEEEELGPGPYLQVLTNGRLSLVSRGRPDGPRTVTSEACDRAYAAAGTVVCLRPVDSSTGTQLVVLDSRLHERQSVALKGFPSRTRVSPSGRMVAWTLLLKGHSYASGGFPKSTGILDTHTGTVIPSLEELAVVKDGQPYRAADVNVWGVTFADDNRFYASMFTGGQSYLVEGDVAARRVRTVVQGVECPSLSPDGTRIVFKHTIGDLGDQSQGPGSHADHGGSQSIWQLSILELKTLQITHLAEKRSVDDQAVWLDNATVAYTLQRPDGTNDVWAVPADATGAPRVLVPDASSPAPPQ
jgi:WD40-like Beta Propeller Repeat